MTTHKDNDVQINSSKRIANIDIAKFIAMTCVIFGHRFSWGYAVFWPFHLPILARI